MTLQSAQTFPTVGFSRSQGIDFAKRADGDIPVIDLPASNEPVFFRFFGSVDGRASGSLNRSVSPDSVIENANALLSFLSVMEA